jgi:hypothetical protein
MRSPDTCRNDHEGPSKPRHRGGEDSFCTLNVFAQRSAFDPLVAERNVQLASGG